MLLPVPTPFRRRRRRSRVKNPPGAAGPVLVSATLIPPDIIRLRFDREVIAPNLDASQIRVQTPQQPNANEWFGLSQAGRPGPFVIDVTLQKVGPPSGTIDTLTASAGTGIESLDAETWAGVTGLPLPFGE